MGNREMPQVADFLDIRPVTPEQVRKLGYLPQCTFGDGKPEPKHRPCFRQSEWTVESNYHCDDHKKEVEMRWKSWIAEWIAEPEGASHEDLELLELVRGELESHGHEIYPAVAVERVVKDLSLPDTKAGCSLAAWYLWEMGVFSIHQRVRFFENAASK